MRFTSLHMENFRGTHELDIDFEPDITVIVGRNGAGKSSILDALGMMMKFVRAHIDGRYRINLDRNISPQDVRENSKYFLIRISYEVENSRIILKNPSELEIVYVENRQSLRNDMSRDLKHSLKSVDHKPRFIYYRQVRGFEPKKMGRNVDDLIRTLDPESVQTHSLNEDLQAIGDLELWWDRRDADEARRVRDDKRNYRDPQLEAIRKLITKIDSFSGISFTSTSSPPGLHFLKNDGTPVHVNSLSGGERSYIILLADLARRLQVFAPGKRLEEISAIVLIDEIELNLHPAWQSEIVPALTAVFRACQFIVTTHSPQVLSGVDNGKVRMIEEDVPGRSSKVTGPLSTKGRTSNYLLEGIFDASERYPPIERLIDDFNRAIDKGDGEKATKILTSIENEIEEDTATVLVLRKRLKNLRFSA